MSQNKDEILEKLTEARRLLVEARDISGLGTSLMVDSIIHELNGIIERFKHINNATNDETSPDDRTDES